MKKPIITHLFVDIGGVLLTNGWDRHSRERAAAHFNLNREEIEDRHRLIFDVYEAGKLTLEDYLNQVIFYKKQPFTETQFRSFMHAESAAYPKMIGLVRQLKAKYGLKIIVVSNEARELNAHRIQTFKLYEFVDAFISSCYVHLRKPDLEIFRLALDISQAQAERTLYIENTPMFVEMAQSLGIPSILHTSYISTCAKLASLGLHIDEKPI